MAIYINGIGSISAQKMNTRSASIEFEIQHTNPMVCKEPDYKELIAPMQLRRMSKVVRMGIATAKQALLDAGIEKPDIITIGTAYGCLADTEFFLNKLISQEEQMLTPTSFIQSTHNTVSGQIALMLTCHGHNFTFVHKGHSFETAMQDAMMWLNEKKGIKVLTGGIDELTQHSQTIISRFGTYKKEGETIETLSNGTIAGEGSNLFLLSKEKTEKSYAELVDLHLCYSLNIQQELQNFLIKNNLSTKDIDTCFIGLNFDERYDNKELETISILENASFITFKNLSGEYPTSNAFALSLACKTILNGNHLISINNKKTIPNNVLIYNHYKGQFHSFILLKKL